MAGDWFLRVNPKPMEAKKNPRYDVQRQSGKFFLIGLVLSSAMAITAYEWTSIKKVYPPRPHDNKEEMPYNHAVRTDHPKPEEPKVKAPKIVIRNPDITKLTLVQDDQPEDSVSIVKQNEQAPLPAPPIEKPIDDDQPWISAEIQPTPVNGLARFYEQIGRELKYPKQARQMNVEGRVVVQFVVSKTGELTDFTILRSLGAGCDEEAIRVLSKTKWEPGRQRGKPVRVRMAMVVNFRLHH
ncbi:MAG TPA: energy transducer TonB [Cytophagales bacterium]|nr:energy transducer TonB [Cytophagales bacterium]